ncbi:MAG: hypothetical protein HC822_27775 [Oscillochloris sp.]|nr:hypothetical protein [Oscillochloris sp.]
MLDTTTLVQDYERTDGLNLETISTISQQVLLLYGSKSHYLGTYEALRTHLPNVNAHLIADSQHFAVVEQPAMLLEHVNRFLADTLIAREHGT